MGNVKSGHPYLQLLAKQAALSRQLSGSHQTVTKKDAPHEERPL